MSRYDDPDLYPDLSPGQEQELADLYTIENLAAREVAERMNLSQTEVKCVRHRYDLRHSEPAIIEEMTEDEAAGHVTEVKRRASIEKKAARRARREEENAARKWWTLEESLSEAAGRFEAPTLSTPPERLSVDPELPDGAAIYNATDFHVGKRPAMQGETLAEYIGALLEASKKGFQRLARNANLERIYLVIGGDLVHVDGVDGATSQGTPQDLQCSPVEALTAAQELSARL